MRRDAVHPSSWVPRRGNSGSSFPPPLGPEALVRPEHLRYSRVSEELVMRREDTMATYIVVHELPAEGSQEELLETGGILANSCREGLR